MSSEAKAMLDALMGNARNAALPASTNGGDTDWDSLRPKKSCYDRDVCPLYCAWSVSVEATETVPDSDSGSVSVSGSGSGIDVYELFTNTKSDLGPNPYAVSEDAREEFMGLPDHEKDRLGFETMLHRKLGDLVRGCDRIVSRNKEKLRQEISKAARSRGLSGGNKIDPVTDISDEMIMDAAGIMAELELKEEEVKEWLGKIMEMDGEWRMLYGKLQTLEKEKILQEEQQQKAEEEKLKKQQQEEEQNDEANAEGNVEAKTAEDESTKDAPVAAPDGSETADTKADTTNGDVNDEVKTPAAEELKTNTEDEKKDDEKDTEQNTNATNDDGDDDNDTSTPTIVIDYEEQIQKIKSKLYSLSHESQKLITKISIDTSQTIVPLRDNLQNFTKQLYYVKTDMSSDKTVCEVSGNFMSSRDAEERIAAHYAGKQYVGWKLVREKFKELDMKMRNGRPGNGGDRSGMGGMGGDRGGGGRGPPPRGGGGYDQGGGGGYRGRGGYDQGGGYGGGGGGYRNGGGGGRDRSRDRDRDRWQRDRGPGYGGGGGGGGGHHGGGGGGYGRRR